MNSAVSGNMVVLYFKAFEFCFAAALHRIAIAAFFLGFLY